VHRGGGLVHRLPPCSHLLQTTFFVGDLSIKADENLIKEVLFEFLAERKL